MVLQTRRRRSRRAIDRHEPWKEEGSLLHLLKQQHFATDGTKQREYLISRSHAGRLERHPLSVARSLRQRPSASSRHWTNDVIVTNARDTQSRCALVCIWSRVKANALLKWKPSRQEIQHAMPWRRAKVSVSLATKVRQLGDWHLVKYWHSN